MNQTLKFYFSHPKMTKNLLSSMLTSKSSLSEIIFTPPSLNAISDGCKVETCVDMKFITSRYSHGNMNELAILLAKFYYWYFTIGIYLIKYGSKKYFYQKVMGLVRNAINFIVCFHGLLNHIFNCNYLDTHILSYDEIANRVERAFLSSMLMGNGDTETGLKKLKETLKDLANP